VHDAIEETLACLDSVRSCTEIPHTVTIVDDASGGGTREQLRQYTRDTPWIRLIALDDNLGYTRAANVGLMSSRADWVVLLNSDTIVSPGWLTGMFEVTAAKPDVVLVGPLSNAASWQSVPDLTDVTGKWKVNDLPEGCTVAEMAEVVRSLSVRGFPEVPLLNGFCTLMRRKVVEEVGFLDEVAFPIGYGEENDLCVRVAKAGYKLAIADHVYVYHTKSASFGTTGRDRLASRGAASFASKHPEVNIAGLQQVLAESTPLFQLRKALRQHLEARQTRAVSPQLGS
jgi:GT2 family glycosyltransferase